MLLFTNLREIIIAILAFILWGWLGFVIAFVLLFAINLFEHRILAWFIKRFK